MTATVVPGWLGIGFRITALWTCAMEPDARGLGEKDSKTVERHEALLPPQAPPSSNDSVTTPSVCRHPWLGAFACSAERE